MSRLGQARRDDIKAVTFDVGGTLLYLWPSVGHIYAEVLRNHGVNLPPDPLDRAFVQVWQNAHTLRREGKIGFDSERIWWREIVRLSLAGQPLPADFDRFYDELWNTFCAPERWRLFAGARETLAELRRRGYRLAVLSNWDERLRPLLAGLRLDSLFEDLIISSEVGAEKPNPAIFRVAERRLGLAPGQIVHIGDSEPHDQLGAEAAGWPYVMVDHHGRQPVAEPYVRGLPALLERL